MFDFDGVLCQSMEQHAEAYRRVLEPFGVRVADQDVFEHEGARSETILRDLLGAKARDGQNMRALADEKQRIFLALGKPPVYPGAEAALEAATGPRGLVTGTRRANLEALVPAWVPRFDAIMTQESYTHDKPHPEPYARAAEALGVDPATCMAVENAVRGIQSAKAAGYGRVVAITTTMPANALAEADCVVESHAALAREVHAWARDGSA